MHPFTATVDWAQLAGSVSVPLAVALVSWPIARSLRRLEHAQWNNRTLIELRLDLYRRMAPQLNDLLCFFRCVGDYQNITPPDALALKRSLDKTFFVNEVLLSEELGTRYEAFMHACFSTYAARAKPAQLRASARRQRLEREAWDPSWDAFLIPVDSAPAPLEEISNAYRGLMDAFRADVRVVDEAPRRRL